MSSISPTALEQTAPPLQTGESRSKGEEKPKSRQRFKPQLSCTLCRTRKLKCDRNSPCQNCQKRGLASTCTYIHASVRRNKPPTAQKTSNDGPRDFQSQVAHLEELVVSLMNRTNAITTPTKASSSQPSTETNSRTSISESTTNSSPEDWTEAVPLAETTESFEKIDIQDDQNNYVGDTHWSAILDSIALLKDQAEDKKAAPPEPQCEPSPSNRINGPTLLVGFVPRATRSEILAFVPSKQLCDKLVYAWTGSGDLGAMMLHVPTFEKQASLFWVAPQSASMMWVALLFSVIGLSSTLEKLSGGNSFKSSTDLAFKDQDEAIDIFREKTVQCLILGNYTEPSPYTIETLLIYYITDQFRSPDVQLGTWLIFGMIVRAAMRLGYHRDGSHSPKISVFQAEMQRRLWATIVHLDIQTSCQVGLPRMVRESMYDTKPPRVLLDTDFDENSTALPQSADFDESIPMCHTNVKGMITKIFGNIVDFANSTTPATYEQVMKLDRTLHDAHDSAPAFLKIGSMDDMNTGTLESRMHRFGVDLVFQKSRCILHRKYLVPSKTNLAYPYPYSVTECVEASVRLLQAQIYIYIETQPGEMLYDQRWRASALITHDFLLAAMILAVYIGHCVVAEPLGGESQMGVRVKWAREELLLILEKSQKIWEETSSTSKESAKAAKALGAMMVKVKEAGMRKTQGNGASRIIPQLPVQGATATSVQAPGSFLKWT
ncbi:hypothetical protein B0J14DRAFT_493185 [Halenospora varia]|nr:hypothetical protein B0J14DRAFT_493185 [Halenospora varia]